MRNTYNHFLHLILQGPPRNHLHILQPTQNLVMNGENRLHAKRSSFLDGEGVVLEICEGAFLFEVDDDVWTTFDFKT